MSYERKANSNQTIKLVWQEQFDTSALSENMSLVVKKSILFLRVNGLISHRVAVSALVSLLLLAIVSVSFVVNFLPLAHSSPTYGQAQIIATGQGFPVDIAVGSDGTVYWANQHPFGSGTLVKLAPGAATPTVLLDGLSYVQGIGVDAAGNVYYDEYMGGILYELPAGSTTPQVLATGLDYPNFMSVDAAGDVYFITGQTCGNKIAEYNAATGTVSTVITAAQLDGVFIHPSGDLYFVTCSNQQIERLPKGSSTPQVIFTWTGSSKPEGIAVDGTGNVFFTIYGESVQVLPAGSSTPTVLASVPSFTDGYAHQMALDLCDNAYFIDSYAGNVWKIPTTTPCVPSYGPSQVLVTGQGYPISIGVDGAGSVYWANQADGRMFKLPRGSSVPTLLLSGLQNVVGLSVDAAGNVYYNEYFGGTLNELPAGAGTPRVLMTGLDFPNFMTVDRSGSSVYFVTGQTCGDKIVKFDVASHALTSLLTAPSPHDTDHGFDGLFINSLGDLYFSTCDYLTINRLPRGSSTPQVIMTVNTRPEGIAVDNAGNVFFTLYYQSVDVLPVGSSAPIILATGSTLHQLALDSDDNVYYTDSAGGKIWRIPVVNPLSGTTTTSGSSTSASTSTLSTSTSTGTTSPTTTTIQTQTSTTSAATSTVSTATTTMSVIRGTVYWYDSYGNLHPLLWVQIGAVSQEGTTIVTSSFTDGTYVMYVNPGTYNVSASSDPGFIPQTHEVTVTLGGVATVDFQLQPSGCPVGGTCTATTTLTQGTTTLSTT